MSKQKLRNLLVYSLRHFIAIESMGNVVYVASKKCIRRIFHWFLHTYTIIYIERKLPLNVE